MIFKWEQDSEASAFTGLPQKPPIKQKPAALNEKTQYRKTEIGRQENARTFVVSEEDYKLLQRVKLGEISVIGTELKSQDERPPPLPKRKYGHRATIKPVPPQKRADLSTIISRKQPSEVNTSNALVTKDAATNNDSSKNELDSSLARGKAGPTTVRQKPAIPPKRADILSSQPINQQAPEKPKKAPPPQIPKKNAALSATICRKDKLKQSEISIARSFDLQFELKTARTAPQLGPKPDRSQLQRSSTLEKLQANQLSDLEAVLSQRQNSLFNNKSTAPALNKATDKPNNNSVKNLHNTEEGTDPKRLINYTKSRAKGPKRKLPSHIAH